MARTGPMFVNKTLPQPKTLSELMEIHQEPYELPNISDEDILEHLNQSKKEVISDRDIERLTKSTQNFRQLIEIQMKDDLVMFGISGLDYATFPSVQAAYAYAKDHKIPLINQSGITADPEQTFEYLYGLTGGSILKDSEGNYTNKTTSILYLGYLMGLKHPVTK